MNRILVVLIIIGATRIAGAQPERLQLPATRGAADGDGLGPRQAVPPIVELLTFGVGDRIFEKFGHAAICLRYQEPRDPPICFNYGVTDFSEGPVMIWSFLRSQQKFWVEPSAWGELDRGAGPPRGMIGFYSGEDRDIWSQRLPLTGDQARAIEAKLWDSAREAARYYYYDHFFDNCTTRLRDMIDEVTGGKLRAGTDVPYPLTFREIGRRGLSGIPALVALTDFVIGRQADDTPTVWQAMFHPDVLRQMVASQLGVKPAPIYTRHGEPFPVDGPTGRTPMLLIALVFALPLLLSRRISRRVARLETIGVPRLALPLLGVMTFAIGALCLWIGVGVGGVVGAATMLLGLHLNLAAVAMSERMALVVATLPLALWGLAIYGLVIVSSIDGVRWNEAVFVVMPLDAVLPFLGEPARRRYARLRVAGLALVSLLCAIGVFHQPLWVPIATAFLPLAILAFDLQQVVAGRRADGSDPALPRAVVVEPEETRPQGGGK